MLKTQNVKPFIAMLFLIWSTLILASFFIVQKPTWVSVIAGLGNLIATIGLWFLFIYASVHIGYPILKPLNNNLILSAGMGMGILGSLAFILVTLKITNTWVLFSMLVVSIIITRKNAKKVLNEFHTLIQHLIHSTQYAPKWIPYFAGILLSFSFLLALAPPIEAFDGLFYHLTLPVWWLQDGGIQLVNMPHYWFPALMEGMFLFPLAFDLDATPQLIHWAFAVLTLSLLFQWTQRLFGSRAAWWAIAVVISMPSLPWIAAWAYTDLGLAFYAFATLFTLSAWRENQNATTLILSGVFCGFAMGIKYTAFMLPVSCLICLLFWFQPNWKKTFRFMAIFSIFSILAGGIWYLRNLIWTGNPVYPFALGGPFWDSFRATWYSGAGSGIGFNLKELIALPFITMLGFKDQNFFDGRIGPFYLILFPILLFYIWGAYRDKAKQFESILPIFIFGFLGMLFWIFGVIQTAHLMQSRLLLPSLFALLPLFGKSILVLESWGSSKFNIRFIFSSIFMLAILVICIDFILLVSFRNPIMATLSSQSRADYTQRFNDTYAQLLTLSEKTPENAYVYLLNEPRSYGIQRHIQPDPINDNLPHDFYLYKTNNELISAWKQIGYTHILTRSLVFADSNENQHALTRLNELRNMLVEINQTEEYILFEIP